MPQSLCPGAAPSRFYSRWQQCCLSISLPEDQHRFCQSFAALRIALLFLSSPYLAKYPEYHQLSSIIHVFMSQNLSTWLTELSCNQSFLTFRQSLSLKECLFVQSLRMSFKRLSLTYELLKNPQHKKSIHLPMRSSTKPKLLSGFDPN